MHVTKKEFENACDQKNKFENACDQKNKFENTCDQKRTSWPTSRTQ